MLSSSVALPWTCVLPTCMEVLMISKFQGAHWNGDPLVTYRRRGVSPDAFLEAQRRDTLLLSEGESVPPCISCCCLHDSITTLPNNSSLCHNLKLGIVQLLAAGFHAQVRQQRWLRHPGDYPGEHPGPAAGGGPRRRRPEGSVHAAPQDHAAGTLCSCYP